MPMIHPLFRLIASRPQMLADHVEAYSDLVAQEVDLLAAGWKQRALLAALAFVTVGVALILAGVAAMLWAVVPLEQIRAPWALLVVPAVPALVCIGCWLGLRQTVTAQGFKTVREQFAADVAMLREVSGSS